MTTPTKPDAFSTLQEAQEAFDDKIKINGLHANDKELKNSFLREGNLPGMPFELDEDKLRSFLSLVWHSAYRAGGEEKKMYWKSQKALGEAYDKGLQRGVQKCIEAVPERMTERNMAKLSEEFEAQTVGEVEMWNAYRATMLEKLEALRK